ncbi:MAG: pseudouridine synthase [Flavobacteriaceae bacterium]|nr:pseudouridine synthase [Flavobacteriaceae bacterium]
MNQHFVLHKPPGVLSQFKYEGKRKSRKRLLGDLYDFPEGTMAIGRLDENSEGLLLLTTDGKMSEYVRSSQVEKEYLVQVAGIINQEAIDVIQKGVLIGTKTGKYLTKPCKASLIDNIEEYLIEPRFVREARHGPLSWASITLTEGKYKQVRKMTAAVGYPTLRLIRVRIGTINLDLNIGEVKKVNNLRV